MQQQPIVMESSEKTNISWQQKDTRYRKIFVGGLPYHTTDDSLRDYFAVFGDIEEAVVITDRQTGKSKGYGFVTMTDAASAERACKDPNPIIDGRKANVNLAYIGAKPRNNATAGLRPVPAGAILPVASHLTPPFQVVYQPHIPSHYVSPTVTPTAYSAALSHDVIGPGNMLNVSNAYPNFSAPIQASNPTYILPTIPTQPGIQLSSLPASGLAYATVAPAASEAQNPGVIAGSTQPTYAHLVAQLQQQPTDRQ